MSDALLLEQQGEIATLTLNRPEKRNAITLEMYRALPDHLRHVEENADTKVLTIRGAGDRAFAAGADISEFEQVRATAADAKVYNQHVADAERALAGLSKPTIAMVHGYCIGGGCGLATACDFRFSDDTGRFGITPAKLGLVYSLESTKRLVDLVGPATAKYILMSGRQLTAERAYEVGLIDQIHPAGELHQASTEFAELLSVRAQYSVRAVKQIIRRIEDGQSHDNDDTRRLRNDSFDTDDYAEGVRAFLERREPHFTWS